MRRRTRRWRGHRRTPVTQAAQPAGPSDAEDDAPPHPPTERGASESVTHAQPLEIEARFGVPKGAGSFFRIEAASGRSFAVWAAPRRWLRSRPNGLTGLRLQRHARRSGSQRCRCAGGKDRRAPASSRRSSRSSREHVSPAPAPRGIRGKPDLGEAPAGAPDARHRVRERRNRLKTFRCAIAGKAGLFAVPVRTSGGYAASTKPPGRLAGRQDRIPKVLSLGTPDAVGLRRHVS